MTHCKHCHQAIRHIKGKHPAQESRWTTVRRPYSQKYTVHRQSIRVRSGKSDWWRIAQDGKRKEALEQYYCEVGYAHVPEEPMKTYLREVDNESEVEDES